MPLDRCMKALFGMEAIMSNTNYRVNDLFKPSDDWQLNACVGKNGGPYDFQAYSVGYFNAARVLVDAILVDSIGIDLAIYPIVYCYRHGIELGLKYLANLLPEIWNEVPQSMRATHELTDVWRVVKPYLLRDKAFDESGANVPYVEDVINDIIQFDPKAEVFRFPSDSRSHQFFLQDSAHINIGVLNSTLEAVRNIFDGWFIAGTAILDFNYEAREASV